MAAEIVLTDEDLLRMHRHFVNLMCQDSGAEPLRGKGGKPAIYNFSAFIVEFMGFWVAITAGNVFGNVKKAVALGSVLSNGTAGGYQR